MCISKPPKNPIQIEGLPVEILSGTSYRKNTVYFYFHVGIPIKKIKYFKIL